VTSLVGSPVSRSHSSMRLPRRLRLQNASIGATNPRPWLGEVLPGVGNALIRATKALIRATNPFIRVGERPDRAGAVHLRLQGVDPLLTDRLRRLGGRRFRAASERPIAGDEGIRATDEGRRLGSEGIGTADEGLSAGSEPIRADDEPPRLGSEAPGLRSVSDRAGRVCSSPTDDLLRLRGKHHLATNNHLSATDGPR
jgi:hypothetical protein